MVRHFKIQCPRCAETCELYLSSNAPIVILNCPNCWTPMLHNENGVYVLSQHQMAQLAQSRGRSLMNLLERTGQRERVELPQGLAEAHEAFDAGPAAAGTSSPASGFESRDSISSDDIVDLRIELETCKDSLEFISKI